MRKKLAIPFTAAVLVATALVVPAASARDTKPAAGPPTSSPTAETCTEVRQNVKALARAGAKTAYCSAGAHAVAEVAAADDPPLNPICRSALGLPPNTWPENRTETCSAWGEWLLALNADTGEEIGRMEIRHLSYYATDLNFATFSLLFYVKATQIRGRGFESARIKGTPRCYDGHGGQAGCDIAPASFEEQAFDRLGAVWSVSAEFRSAVDIPGEVQHLGGWLEWEIYSATGVPMGTPSFTSVPPHPVQCDWTAEDHENDPGCVLDDYVPIFDVYRSRYPAFHDHIKEAFGVGLPRVLTRMINPERRDANGRAACPGRYERPPGHECDEYPFRSTHEGAAEALEIDPNVIGTTHPWCQLPDLAPGAFGAGWSSCMIPANQNRLGGIDLGQFYARNRLIDGDRFGVQPING